MKTPATCIAAILLGLSAGPGWAQKAAPTDAQIAAIVATANQVDIDAGKLAESRSKSKDVRDFAQLMVTDQTGVNKATDNLVTRLHVTPELTPTSLTLQKSGDQNLATLKKLDGHAFDKAYVDHEVVYNESVLKALDKTLIPDAKSPELKALLVKVRPAFEAHLERARKLQADLSGSGA